MLTEQFQIWFPRIQGIAENGNSPTIGFLIGVILLLFTFVALATWGNSHDVEVRIGAARWSLALFVAIPFGYILGNWVVALFLVAYALLGLGYLASGIPGFLRGVKRFFLNVFGRD